MSNAWLGGFTRQLTEEVPAGPAGRRYRAHAAGRADVHRGLRRYLEELPPGQTGWLAGLRDEVVGRVLALLHARPGHPWTLDELAREAASSRSNVAKRFTELVGQPPMQYLTRWRMQVAANLLAQAAPRSPLSARRSGTTPRPRSAGHSRRRPGSRPAPGAGSAARPARSPSHRPDRDVRASPLDSQAGNARPRTPEQEVGMTSHWRNRPSTAH